MQALIRCFPFELLGLCDSLRTILFAIRTFAISTYNADVMTSLSFRWTQPATWPWVVWVWLAFLLVGAIKPTWQKIKTRLVNSWPSVTGKIERVDVNEPKGFLGLKTSSTPRYFAEITYSYGVDGNAYTGTNRREFGDQDEAWDFLRDLKGKAVVVHYIPGKPGASSLSEPSLEVLLQTRPPMPPGSSRAATRMIPSWIRPFLWWFAGLSLLGLVLSVFVHINAMKGNQMPSIFWETSWAKARPASSASPAM